MATIEPCKHTIERLDSLGVDRESDDETVNQLVTIYETEEMTLFHAGGEV